ncbi:hypothetical protein RMR10_011845 [Agrobacterium rosae]|uniref:hypothetical protein n=1 Tax=Agrobacterium rosae TaxID=1972867 RepID=UPI002A0C348B|nr:hypothetical protein [Agrobacterium rosae]MDX8313320.1 hypothetical protein [Agrobacterium rosae]
MLKLLPEWLKLGAAAVVAVVLFGPVIHFLGKRDGRTEERAAIEVKAAKEALKRIDNLEKNNASFRNLDSHHRCLVFARDSGLPDSTCDD